MMKVDVPDDELQQHAGDQNRKEDGRDERKERERERGDGKLQNKKQSGTHVMRVLSVVDYNPNMHFKRKTLGTERTLGVSDHAGAEAIKHQPTASTPHTWEEPLSQPTYVPAPGE